MRIHWHRLDLRFPKSVGDDVERASVWLAAGFGTVILFLMFYAVAVARGW